MAQLEQVEAVQKKTREQYAELAASINEKQKGAEEARDENIRKTLEKLKEKVSIHATNWIDGK